MSTNSYTGTVNTQGQFKKIADVTGFDFIEDNTYTMQVWDGAEIKISDAIFYVSKEKFTYKVGTDDIYIKANDCVLTILENQ